MWWKRGRGREGCGGSEDGVERGVVGARRGERGGRWEGGGGREGRGGRGGEGGGGGMGGGGREGGGGSEDGVERGVVEVRTG